MSDDQFDMPFYQLVLSLQAAAVQQLGKVASPLDGQINRDMVMAKGTIDILEMIGRKTQGNLTPDEKKLLDHVLFELRMNFVDEQKKDQKSDHDTAGQDSSGAPQTGAGSEPDR
ncbi:MAG: DUF1844 domain-containing protein [Candidatus Zixiibacteriota bacterium]